MKRIPLARTHTMLIFQEFGQFCRRNRVTQGLQMTIDTYTHNKLVFEIFYQLAAKVFHEI